MPIEDERHLVGRNNMTTDSFTIGRGRIAMLAAAALAVFLCVDAADAQTSQQSPAAEKAPGTGTGEIKMDRKTPLLSVARERESVRVPVQCADGQRKDVELQPADASVTFGFGCLCSEDANALKQAMMKYRDDYMRVYRKEIALEDMGSIADYFADVALPFAPGSSGGTQLTLILEPGEKQERTLYCYTEEDFELIDDWARYIIFGN